MLLGHDKVNLIYQPTPLEKLENISKDLGINLYIKRDDFTPLGVGGNKLRKLEYFVKDAKDKGATLLLTVGGAQTNHGRLTLAAARKFGLKGAIIAVDEYPGELSANLLLDGIMGCDVWLKSMEEGKTEDEVLAETVKEIIAKYEAQGEKVYFIPMGGSNELGILGYYDCALELKKQIEENHLAYNGNVKTVVTVGSMGTYMGLYTGIEYENVPMDLIGVGIMPYEDGIKNYAKDYFKRVQNFYNLEDKGQKDFCLLTEYDFGAYNNPVKEVRDAMYYMGEKEGLILDPCYTGKCFNGLLNMVKDGKIKQGENVIFIHTGGLPGINTPFHRIEIEKEREKFIHII